MNHLALELSRGLAAAIVTAAALGACASPACRARCNVAGACSAKKCGACAAKKCGACAPKK